MSKYFSRNWLLNHLTTAAVFLFSVFTIPHAALVEVDGTTGIDDLSCYSKNEMPCKTLDYALSNGLASSTTIMIHKGIHSLNLDDLSFNNMVNVSIIGVGCNETFIQCNFGAGLSFYNVNQVTLANFTVIGGGRIVNSTSLNATTGEAAVFRAALYLSDCVDVVVDGLLITNSTGTGMVMLDVTGKIEIINSTFQFNKVKLGEHLPGGGGVYITFTYCKHGVIPCNITVTNNAVYKIYNSIFFSNIATSCNVTKISFPVPIVSIRQQFGRGGGLHFTLRGVSQNNSLLIAGCSFIQNRAEWGGGLSIELLDNSTGNNVTIENSLFEDNYLPYNGFVNTTGTGGGAIRISRFSGNISNCNDTVNIKKSTFINNTAAFGGGVAAETQKVETNLQTFIYFSECIWYKNVARLGSAVYAYLHPYPFGEIFKFQFDRCNFTENSNRYSDLSVTLRGHGTVYSISIPVVFVDRNVFTGNYGSALVGISTLYNFNGTVVFENNTANNGGAISLYESSYLILSENAELYFAGNVASGKGGAIYATGATQRDLISNHFCFILFHDPAVSPYKWKQNNINITFSHNHAKHGNSIFTTTLYTCVWEGIPGLKEVQLSDIEQVFYWNKTFLYKGISNITQLKQEISSEAAYIKNIKDETYSIPPGKLYKFGFDMENDRSENVAAVYFTTTNDSSIAVVDDILSYARGYTRLHGNPESSLNIEMVAVTDLPILITVSVKLDNCPPGFYPSFKTYPNETQCKCSVNEPGEDYIGIVKCDTKKLVAYLKPAHYAGYIEKNNRSVLLTSGCPLGYCTDNSSYLELPSNSSAEALDDIVCKPQNRKGTLCGKCVKDHYIYANSFDHECGKCTMSLGLEIFIYILTKYIVLVIFLLIIGFCNISLVSGPLNGFVLFSQSLPYMDIYAGGRIDIPNEAVVKIYRFLYGMWDLKYLEVVVPDMCVFKVQSAMHMMLLDLIPVIVVVIVTIVIYILKVCINIRGQKKVRSKKKTKDSNTIFAKVIKSGCIQSIILEIEKIAFNSNNPRKNSNQASNKKKTETRPNHNFFVMLRIHAILTIIVLCYSRMAAFAFNMLSYTTLYGSSKDDSSDSLKVFWYDGTLEYGQNWYFYVLPAAIVLTLVVSIPLILLIYPFCHIYKCFRTFPCSIIYCFTKCCCCLCMETKQADGEDNQDSFRYTCGCRPCSQQRSKTFLLCNYANCDHTHDAAQECYKSTNFVVARATALYLLYRLVTLSIYAFTSSIELQYLLQSGFFLLMLTIHSCFQPYKKSIYNVIDSCVFINLTLISIISYHRLYSEAQDLTDTNKSFIFQTILIYLPFIYLVSLVCWYMYSSMYSSMRAYDEDDNPGDQYIEVDDDDDDDTNGGIRIQPIVLKEGAE